MHLEIVGKIFCVVAAKIFCAVLVVKNLKKNTEEYCCSNQILNGWKQCHNIFKFTYFSFCFFSFIISFFGFATTYAEDRENHRVSGTYEIEDCTYLIEIAWTEDVQALESIQVTFHTKKNNN